MEALRYRQVDAGSAQAAAAGQDPLRPLIDQALTGSREAQHALLVALGPVLLKVIRSVLHPSAPEVEDTLQEVMLGVYRALPQFRGECSTSTFACRIAFHTAMNARRRAGYRARWTPSVSPEQLGERASTERSPIELLDANSCRQALEALLEELPATQAEVLALHVMQGYTIAQTAEVTSVPIDTVRSRLRNALSKLRHRILGDPALLDVTRSR